MHTLSQSFILNLTPQMIRHRQRVEDFVSCSSNSSHFCHSLKHRHSAMRILKRHYFLFYLGILFQLHVCLSKYYVT
ncbi:hypothetical protein MtrunA17_Chr3g0079501 [Medicago truncatula]|uniref:Transmembrane protein n=1 Tax=Medicago truncatula TaxID=3880 RepID=A0A396III6_MEDTR|nr:hypothetical protein MtrunA17_Chr3g0079501 [Medicago truncatula]